MPTSVFWRDKQYNALLDSGCEVSAIGRRLLPKDIQMSPPESDLYAANRTKIPLLGRIKMDFTVEGGDRYSATLAVTNTLEELILGIDWLVEQDAHWRFSNGKLLLGGRWIKLQRRATADRVQKVYAAGPAIIPPMSEADVAMNVTWPTLHPVHGDWLVESNEFEGKLTVARTLVSGDTPMQSYVSSTCPIGSATLKTTSS